ncbi:DUF4834 family protein [Adhaeribacter terreus]|uniref:DUF4834 family protein n=1 Tax=Adhaeribacter terreus TaxID=529703 RepID=A0ABW0ECM2_9BACT
MFKFIIVSFLIIMFIRLVAPFLLRWLVAFLFKKHIRKTGFDPQQHPFGNSQQHRYQKPSGNVRVDYIPEDKLHQKKDFEGGQYVDYEEIK